jgi:hypothetical protein
MTSTGTIYKLTFPNGKSYIGQTTYTKAQRMAKHKWEAYNAKNGKCCTALAEAWREFGDPVWEVLAVVEKERMDEYEHKFIVEHNTLVPHGYNIKAGGSAEKHPASMVIKRAKSLRKNEEDVNLPMFIKRSKSGTGYSYRVCFPNCANKSFNVLEHALEYHAKVMSGEIIPVPQCFKDAVSEYVFKSKKHGYCVKYGKNVCMPFIDADKDEEQLLEDAKQYVAEKIRDGTFKTKCKNAVQRLNVGLDTEAEVAVEAATDAFGVLKI